MDKSSVRIGIIGTGRIAERFWDECLCVEGIQPVAIYNRHIESVQWFAENKKISADDVLFTDDVEVFYQAVDAVYVASPHEYHVFYTKQSLEHHKHVICEKPMAVTKQEAEDIFALAEEKKLICMEAIKTAYCPGFIELQRLIREETIGTVRDVESTFTKIGTASGREMWSEYGGSFVELGTYVLLPVAKIYGVEGEKPQIHTFSLKGAPRHDSYTKMMLVYQNHVATVKTGLGVKSEGELIISGDKGYIRVPSPWWLTSRMEVHYEDPNRVEIYEKPFEGSGLRYEIAEFVRAFQTIGTKSESDMHLRIKKASEESIWLAEVIEDFRRKQTNKEKNEREKAKQKKKNVKIWAHRGCSMAYPENTLLAFQKAAEIPGLTGVELDVQLTRDDELVVIHDETLDRTTDGCGRVCDCSLQELRTLQITASGRDDIYIMRDEDRRFMGWEPQANLRIPTLEEVFILLKPYCKKNNLLINIELENSVIPYEGMEQKVINLVSVYGLGDYVIYSSFNEHSMEEVHRLDAGAEAAILAGDYHKCLKEFYRFQLNAIHPGNLGMPVNAVDVERLSSMGIPVRMYNEAEPLYGQSRRLPDMDLRDYNQLGATDIFTNVPERYLEETGNRNNCEE